MSGGYKNPSEAALLLILDFSAETRALQATLDRAPAPRHTEERNDWWTRVQRHLIRLEDLRTRARSIEMPFELNADGSFSCSACGKPLTGAILEHTPEDAANCPARGVQRP